MAMSSFSDPWPTIHILPNTYLRQDATGARLESRHFSDFRQRQVAAIRARRLVVVHELRGAAFGGAETCNGQLLHQAEEMRRSVLARIGAHVVILLLVVLLHQHD